MLVSCLHSSTDLTKSWVWLFKIYKYYYITAKFQTFLNSLIVQVKPTAEFFPIKFMLLLSAAIFIT